MTYVLASAARATVGARAGQEDAFSIWPGDGQVKPVGTAGLLTVLADGMGGHRGGAVAGQTACITFTETFAHSDMPVDQRLAAALQSSNQAIADEVQRNASLKGMGCTLIGAWFDDTGMRWTSVGDSLLLLYRYPDVVRLNEDHSLGSYLDEQARRNEISFEEARSNRHRNALRSAVTGAKIDLVDLRGEAMPLMAGDWVLLASDGIASLDGDELADIMYRYRDSTPDKMAQALISAVEAKHVPEQDNTTVVAIRVEGASETSKTRAVTPGQDHELKTRRIGVVSGRKVGGAQAKAPTPQRSTLETLLTRGPTAFLLAALGAFVLAGAIYVWKASKNIGAPSGETKTIEHTTRPAEKATERDRAVDRPTDRPGERPVEKRPELDPQPQRNPQTETQPQERNQPQPDRAQTQTQPERNSPQPERTQPQERAQPQQQPQTERTQPQERVQTQPDRTTPLERTPLAKPDQRTPGGGEPNTPGLGGTQRSPGPATGTGQNSGLRGGATTEPKRKTTSTADPEPGSTISDPNERPADGTPDSTAVPIPQQGGVPGKQSHRQPIWRQEVVRSGPARPKRAEVPKAEVPKVEVPKFELPQQE